MLFEWSFSALRGMSVRRQPPLSFCRYRRFVRQAARLRELTESKVFDCEREGQPPAAVRDD